MNMTAASSFRTQTVVLTEYLDDRLVRTWLGLKNIASDVAKRPITEKANRTSWRVKHPRRVLEQRPINPEAIVTAPAITISHPARLGECSIKNRITTDAMPPVRTIRFKISSNVVEQTAICPLNPRPAMIAFLDNKPAERFNSAIKLPTEILRNSYRNKNQAVCHPLEFLTTWKPGP